MGTVRALRTLIVEDEPIARRRLRKLLGEIAWLDLVGEVGDGPAAIRTIDETRPDLVFLDIQLPGYSGIDVLRRAQHRPAVIFTTAFDRYAVTAFELQAIDYLLKPFGRRRLHAALERVRPTANRRPPALLPNAIAAPGEHLERLYVHDRGRITPIALDEVERLQACGDYVGVWARGRRHLIHIALRDVEERLDPTRFMRIHRSHLVNISAVERVTSHPGGRLLVMMRDGTAIVASRARSAALRRRLR